MKLRFISFGLAALAMMFLPRAGAQNNNRTPGSVVSWSGLTIPYVQPGQPGTRYQAIAAGWGNSVALKSDGTVFAWGDNDHGQSTIPTNLTNAIVIAAGPIHSLALKSDSTVVGWGDNSYGQSTVSANLTGVVAIAAGGFNTLALKSDGKVVAWGAGMTNNPSTGYDYGQSIVPANLTGVIAIAAGNYHSLALKSDGKVIAWGAGMTNNPSTGYDYGQSIVPANLTGVIAIAAGTYHSLALKSDGTVVSWGWNDYGQCLAPTNLTSSVAISAGRYHSLALKSDGTVVAWGDNSYGQSTVPTNLTGVIAITAGTAHSLALKSDGTIVAWGWNYACQSMVENLTGVIAIAANGQNRLALKTDGTVTDWGDINTGAVNPTGVTVIAAGPNHSLALKPDGSVVAWGSNSSGQITVPTNMTGVIAIAAGTAHSLALKSDGSVVAWGSNYYDESTVPTNLTGVIAITAGMAYSLALKSDGRVVAWGYNSSGQSTVPTNLTGVIAIAAGAAHSLALKSDGTIVAWGSNYYCQSTVPMNLTGVIAIVAGDYESLALKLDGTVVAWGWNNSGYNTVPANLTSVIAIAAGSYASLALVAPSNQSPAIVVQPVSQKVQAGNNVTFTLTATGSPPPYYQWRFNGQNLSGQTAASLARTNVQFANAGGYSVVVANAYGCVTSAVAQLTVFTNLALIQTNRTPQATEIGKSTIPTDPNQFKVYANKMFQGGVALDPNKMTVVMTHGWNSSSKDWAEYMAQIIGRRIGSDTVNLVAWDWTAAAQSEWYDLGVIAAKTPGQGSALGANLVAALGANYAKRIHFVGHSLGTLVNGAAANYVHAHGFSWTNTQMTLCDEAEVAWEFTSTGWQMATTLPEILGQTRSTLTTLSGNASTPQRYWDQPLPERFAWADNYISAVGLLHSEAANAILTYTYPVSFPDMDTLILKFRNFHAYAHYFYEDTIQPGIFNTGGQSNATYMGFICSFEGGGSGGRPAANTYFYQDPNGFELNLVQTNIAFATNFLNARFDNYWAMGKASIGWQAVNWGFNEVGDAVGQVSGIIQSTAGMIINLVTGSGGGTPHIQSLNVRSLGGPVPVGGSAANTPAYAWIPLAVPSNAVSMSFNCMLQGNGNQDSFQVALQSTNILSLETVLMKTNVTFNSGLVDVKQYAGQMVELFLGIVGGTSTNAAITVSDFQFYSMLPPSLQVELSGTNVVLAWPLSAAAYVLQTTTNLATPNSWMIETNVPSIVDFRNTVTNQISGGSRFYRLATLSTAIPTLQAQLSGKNLVFLWPTAAAGYVLETTTHLTATNSWIAVTNMPTIVNLHNAVTNPVSGGTRFYRLKK